MKNKDKKKVKYSKFIVFLVIMLNFWFARKVLNAFISVGSEPSMLIGAWFAFTTGELFMLSGIKKKEIKKDNESKDSSTWKGV